jgi:hypothetical protein
MRRVYIIVIAAILLLVTVIIGYIIFADNPSKSFTKMDLEYYLVRKDEIDVRELPNGSVLFVEYWITEQTHCFMDYPTYSYSNGILSGILDSKSQREESVGIIGYGNECSSGSGAHSVLELIISLPYKIENQNLRLPCENEPTNIELFGINSNGSLVITSKGEHFLLPEETTIELSQCRNNYSTRFIFHTILRSEQLDLW